MSDVEMYLRAIRAVLSQPATYPGDLAYVKRMVDRAIESIHQEER